MNAGSWLVLAVLVLIVALIIRGMIRDKKKGKSLNCGDCHACQGGDGVCPADKMTLDMARAMEEASRKK